MRNSTSTSFIVFYVLILSNLVSNFCIHYVRLKKYKCCCISKVSHRTARPKTSTYMHPNFTKNVMQYFNDLNEPLGKFYKDLELKKFHVQWTTKVVWLGFQSIKKTFLLILMLYCKYNQLF